MSNLDLIFAYGDEVAPIILEGSQSEYLSIADITYSNIQCKEGDK